MLRFAPRLGSSADRQAGLEGTGEIVLRHLVKESLRMRPSRIIVGEVRAAECLDLLLALNAGLPGMASIHANSARQALVKMCTLPLLAGGNISVLSGFSNRAHRALVQLCARATTARDHQERRQEPGQVSHRRWIDAPPRPRVTWIAARSTSGSRPQH